MLRTSSFNSFSSAVTAVNDRHAVYSRTPSNLSTASTLVEQAAGPIPPRESRKMGPMQRLLLQKVGATQKEWESAWGKTNSATRETTKRLRHQLTLGVDKARNKMTGAECVAKDGWELEALASSSACKDVRKITLDGPDFTNADLELLKHTFPNLREVSVTSSCLDRITDQGLAHLAGLPLKKLEIRGGDITDAGLRHLAGMPLTHLSLNGSGKITGAIFQVLEQSNIQHLELAATGIGSFPPATLASLVRMKKLKHLDIRSAYQECSVSAFNLMRAMLDSGLRSDGPDPSLQGQDAEDSERPLLKQLLEEGRIRHTPSISWVQKLEGITTKPSLASKALDKSGVSETLQMAAMELQGRLIEKATGSEIWQRKGEIPPMVATRFMEALFAANPHLVQVASYFMGAARSVEQQAASPSDTEKELGTANENGDPGDERRESAG